MDRIFKEFEEWYLSKKANWQKSGIIVEKAGLGKYGHQYWINLQAQNGLGHIVLYESNGYYWVDFHAGNYNCNDVFAKSGIEFNCMNDLDTYENEFINYIIDR